MTTGTGVSVVIPHYGDAAPTLDLIRDLGSQQVDRPVEVIVVDDASPEPFPTTDACTVIRRKSNGGFGSAVDTGAAEAHHPYLLILNSDLRVDVHFVESMALAAIRWEPAVVGPRLVDPEGNDQHSARRFPRVSHYVVEWLTPLVRFRDRPLLQRAVGYDLAPPGDGDRPVDWLVGAALCLPTEVFRRAGGFDETFFMNCEEVDLQRRLRRQGVPSVLVEGPTATHLGGASSADLANRRRWVVSARRHYAEKWGGLRRMQSALTLATAVNLIWNGGRRLAGRPVRPLTATREELRLIWGPRSDDQPEHLST